MPRNMKLAILLATINFIGAIWPVTYLVNRIQPFVFGFPFFLFWTTLWILVCFMNLVFCYLLVERKRGDRT